MTRLIRLITMILEVRTNSRQQPEQLWHSMGISRSQFFEDKRALANLGFVFDYDRKEGCYKITEDPYLPVFNLEAGEVFSLVMAVRQLSAAGDHTLTYDAVNAIRKIISQADTGLRALLVEALDDVVLKRTFHAQPAIIEALRQAQQSRQVLEILYDDFSHGRERMMTIDVYTLYFKGRALYLDAFVHEEERVLMLRVSRVKHIARKLSSFKVRDDYNFKERHRHSYRVITKEAPPQRVRIKFAPPAARYIAEAHWHDSEKMFHNDADGSLILELTVSEPKEVLWYLVMPWGEAAEILEPEWLREEAVRMTRNILAKYQTSGSKTR